MDKFDKRLFEELYSKRCQNTDESEQNRVKELFNRALDSKNLTSPIIELFKVLLESKCPPDKLGLKRGDLEALAIKHMSIDEHRVSVGGRVLRALNIVKEANKRVEEYLKVKDKEVKSGIELWDKILENQQRIKKELNISQKEWDSYEGQIRNAIDSTEKLAKILNLNEKVILDIARVTKHYRMRISPYYASLIMPGEVNDPILLQSVPTGEMIDNAGIEIEPVAADHSPARLIDQFYPRVLSIKVTNMCAMYCTHCLRIAHIGDKDKIYSNNTYKEALDYVRENKNIRDVLITGGDALVLSNSKLKFLLEELDNIEHVKVKRVGTRIPITSPQRIDSELLEILDESNNKKPIRLVTQINSAREITPVTREVFKKLNRVTSAILNQAVLLRGINDTKAKMWKLCEIAHENYVRPYYLFNCSYRNPQFAHLRVPIEIGRDIVESMYGNISGDAIPRYIATAGGKIPLHKSNVKEKRDDEYILIKPWSGEEVSYVDMSMQDYLKPFSFERYL